jgi:hypothetical protein
MKVVVFALLLGLTPCDETVEVVLKNSKTLKGELQRENLRGITVAGSEEIRWTAVETVNGRPARERLAQVRESHKKILCPDCTGGLVALLCPGCEGLGKTYQAKPCEKCSGTVVAKSDELVMVQTPDGKFVKIEAAKIAEIRSAPKVPK